ncbi:hypothetical protein RSOLAG22IIIB_10559 [Rhizoctonia solani]|uniref:Uncharacterized protein n=1 Tax=Rhizoctonia solani TaxID=456999 RepID=A0A0K6G4E2_9AGAM|nr:hypothetical protein RSOLAG22IIIB_10559 [Rhizoctonia solani]
MAAANHSIVQSHVPQADINAIPPPLPPPAPDNTPAGPVGAQLLANVAHVVHVDLPQTVAAPNHPLAEAVPEPVGAVVAGPNPLPLGLVVSPLRRSLYGWLLGN